MGALDMFQWKAVGGDRGNIEDSDSDLKETLRILRKSNGQGVHLRLTKNLLTWNWDLSKVF